MLFKIWRFNTNLKIYVSQDFSSVPPMENSRFLESILHFFLLAVVDKISQDFVSKPPILVTAPALIHSARISTILNVPLSPHVALQLTWVRCQVPSSHRGFQ
jgi:hypothetical protein